jgi:hypothetical protein
VIRLAPEVQAEIVVEVVPQNAEAAVTA